MSGLPASLAAVLGILLAIAAAGLAGARALFPPGGRFSAERIGWGLASGLAAVAAAAGICVAAGARPSRWAVAAALLLLAACGLPGLALRAPNGRGSGVGVGTDARPRPGAAAWLLAARALAAAGVLLYVFRAVTEPMWANDFLAIWGLKGRTLFAAGRLPAWLADPSIAGFSHPEYPLGLPLLYAGSAALLGRWDDHATALLFPALQAATLLVLAGWLQRRGASREIAWTAAALLALFEPLYSGFLTGMADVPLGGCVLLLGSALCDAVDETDAGAVRRLALASLFAASVKNEGLFLAGVSATIALAAALPGRRRACIAAAALAPALLVAACHRWALGPARLRDFDFGLLSPGRWGELGPRVLEALSAAATVAASAWAPALCIAVLAAAGRSRPASSRLLALAAAALAAYVLLPAFAVRGPMWLASTTLPRTTAALAPLAAAAIAVRWTGEKAAGLRHGE